MMFEQLNLLESEAERHIAIALSASRKTPLGLNHGAKKLPTEDPDHRDYLDLKDWCQTFSWDDRAKWEDIIIPPKFQNCLWKLVAFSNTSTPAIDPEHQKSRCGDIRDIRRRDGLNDGHTEDIWQARSFRLWASSAVSSMVIIQGTSQTISCLEKFSYEISSQLGEICPTIWMLSEPSSREFFAENDETELLRQLAIQALRKVPHFKAKFITDALRLFKQCATSNDWFQILKLIFQLIPKAYVIVDLGILGSRMNHAKNWPHDFQNLISQLNTNCSSKLAVMLLSSRPLSLGDLSALVVSVTHQSQQLSRSKSLKRPLENLSNKSKKDILTLVTRDKGSSGQAECNSVSALGAERVTHDTICETSARYSSIQNTSNLGASSFKGQRNEEAQICASTSTLNGTTRSVIPHRNSIAIAIICALTLEADAVRATIDHDWDIQNFRNLHGDKNTYSVGSIGCHNVVLLHVSDMGRTAAATVAARCRASFPGINLALVVGICGAVPFHRQSTEILLGDVIISDGLVIYDFGRQFPDTFMRKKETQDNARKAPEEIRGFISKMKGQWGRSMLKSRAGFHLEALLKRGDSPYPGVMEDRLFDPSYRHKHQRPSECAQCASSETLNTSVCEISRISTCDTLGCDPGKLVARQRHSEILSGVGNWLPEIHFGRYASGDRVMKSGEHRDRIAKREEVIAFEMEGAGVWEIFPCIIIKGACDYADSHKNKMWQGYSAVTAAACLKALLEVWPANI
ncbi:nucleoside phosphorylase domain-containing protein [Nemania abortiva]|nr:nucleoside phosphorylase domain-containing protein [Nemania abortiva]